MAHNLTTTKKTLIMGILNITPDSFSDGGLYTTPTQALKRVKQMIHEGADIIDIGGESTRPGSKPISISEELQRVIPVIETIRENLDKSISLSIDTNKAIVAEEALRAGVDMVNSLGGFLFDKKLIDVVAKLHCPIAIYHIQGKPKTMQEGEMTYDDVIKDIAIFFGEQIKNGMTKGIKREQFILDPGIGFGKTVDQNIEIIKRLKEFQNLNLPILIGVSRKSHLGMILQEELRLPNIPSPIERLEASLAETAVAVLNGASIVRTHDVTQTKKFLTILDKFKNF